MFFLFFNEKKNIYANIFVLLGLLTSKKKNKNKNKNIDQNSPAVKICFKDLLTISVTKMLPNKLKIVSLMQWFFSQRIPRDTDCLLYTSDAADE